MKNQTIITQEIFYIDNFPLEMYVGRRERSWYQDLWQFLKDTFSMLI